MPRKLQVPPYTFDEASIINWALNVHEWAESVDNLTTTTVDGARTLLPDESGLILLANTSAFTVTLPKADIVGAGFRYLFIKTTADAFAVTLDGNGSQTINGSTTNAEIDAQYDRIGIVSDGSNWLIYERDIA